MKPVTSAAGKRFRLIGHGVYTLAEGERLTGIPRASIRRWTQGHTYRYGNEVRYTPPAIQSRMEPIDGTPALEFQDLLEVRFLNTFREAGVSWKAIRIASQRAKELLGRHHPFSSRIFKTDGRTILAELVREAGDKVLLDLVRDQYEFERIITPFLYRGIEFDDLDEPRRWWPLGQDRQVVLDPERAFGAPIVPQQGIPTRLLYSTFQAERSVELVSHWYGVSAIAVADAIEFEGPTAS